MEPRASRPQPALSRLLCAVLDARAFGEAPESFAASLFEAGVDWIQLRERSLADEPLYRLARSLTHAASRFSQARVIVNRRADIALAAGADGVHLGFDAIDAASARALLGEAALVGASLHSQAEVAAARGGPLSYAHLAPIWNPVSKPATRPPLGREGLAAATAPGLPLIAQGGLDAERVREALAAGAAGIAVTGRLSQAADAASEARRLRAALDAGHVAA